MLYVDKNFDGPALVPNDAKEAELVMKIVDQVDSVRIARCSVSSCVILSRGV
jgi:hypothetical protein